jgi:hypothetical protein
MQAQAGKVGDGLPVERPDHRPHHRRHPDAIGHQRDGTGAPTVAAREDDRQHQHQRRHLHRQVDQLGQRAREVAVGEVLRRDLEQHHDHHHADAEEPVSPWQRVVDW